jgi:hypothetical protein
VPDAQFDVYCQCHCCPETNLFFELEAAQ